MRRISRYHTMIRMLLSYWQKNLVLKYNPFRLWIEITNVCNLSCIMCLNKSIKTEERGFMEIELFKKIINEAKAFVSSVNLHHRGEPLLHEDLPKMIEYCREHGIYSQLHTNAALLTEDKAYEIITSGLDFISFSFDGFDKSTYENIRVGANFENTLGNITNFLRIKNELKSKIPYSVVEVIGSLRNSISGYEKIRNNLLSLKLDKFIIKQAHNWGGEYEQESNTSLSCKEKSICYPCTFPWYALVVFWDGTVVPCPQDFFGENRFGDLKINSLKEIWNNSALIEFRKQMKERKYQELKPCMLCDRLHRSHFLGIPTSHLRPFIKES